MHFSHRGHFLLAVGTCFMRFGCPCRRILQRFVRWMITVALVPAIKTTRRPRKQFLGTLSRHMCFRWKGISVRGSCYRMQQVTMCVVTVYNGINICLDIENCPISMPMLLKHLPNILSIFKDIHCSYNVKNTLSIMETCRQVVGVSSYM